MQRLVDGRGRECPCRGRCSRASCLICTDALPQSDSPPRPATPQVQAASALLARLAKNPQRAELLK
jgi:hypothetical protein